MIRFDLNTNIGSDYGETKVPVYFEVGGKEQAIPFVAAIDFIEEVKPHLHGFEVNIAPQQIPEIIRELASLNIAVYVVLPIGYQSENME